jgi:hypothetical protein
MDDYSLGTIEFELAILIRRITSITTDKKFANLD